MGRWKAVPTVFVVSDDELLSVELAQAVQQLDLSNLSTAVQQRIRSREIGDSHTRRRRLIATREPRL